MVNEARFQTARRTFDFSAVYNEPSLDISNFIIMGKSTSDVDYYAETRDAARRQHDVDQPAPSVKAGVDINFLRNDAVLNLFFPARMVFPNLGRASRPSRRSSSGGRSSQRRTSYPGISPSWTQAVPNGVGRTTRGWDFI